ncbi:MAG: zinc-ribbon domain-containing protein [Candidatus Berkelbacteria bacterium]|nr:zinc-ribbon domain-containing protein [Candidatus Berkelbacteria bacterium]
MYCSKCGKKLSDKDKFCPKCGRDNSEKSSEVHEEKDKPEESTKPVEAKPPKKANSGLVCCGILLLLIGVPMIFSIGAYSKTAKSGTSPAPDAFVKGLTVVLLALGAALLVWIIVSLIKSFIKKPIKTAIVLGSVLVFAGVIILLSYSYSKSSAADNFNLIQSGLADTLAAQSLGDDIVAEKSDAKFSSVHEKSQKAVDNLSKIRPPASLKDYYNAINDWANKINDSDKTKTKWAKRPDAPDGLKTAISGSVAKNLFQESLNKIAGAKDYGDWAIKISDKDTMRYISAELQAQYIALGDISISYDAPSSNYLAEIFFTPAQAKNTLKFPRGRCPDFGPCHTDLKKKLPPTYQSAHNYSVSDPAAPAQWSAAWDDMLKTITIDDGYNVGGAGITQGKKDAPPISPMQQAFNDECTAKGGTPGGAGGVKDRLPTTLSSGYNCDYKNNGHSCWDFLTTGGGRFMGGDSGCLEQGLLPRPVPTPVPNNGGGNNGGGGNKTSTPKKTAAPTHDGTYRVTYSAAHCNIDVPGGYNSFFDAAGVSDTIVVSSNRVHNFDSSTSAIDSSGNATYNYNFSYGGASSAQLTQTFHFSSNNVSGEVSFNVQAYTEGASGTATCSESFSGSK